MLSRMSMMKASRIISLGLEETVQKPRLLVLPRHCCLSAQDN
jgi:hypothetical protein